MADGDCRLDGSEGEDFGNGLTAGRDWARTAEAADLERLAEASDSPDGLNLDDDAEGAFGPAERFVFVIQPEDADRAGANGFWFDVLGEHTPPSGPFVRGFAEGALEA